jgi:uncharacterized repeat protein (TIGR03833 family)
MSHQVRAGLANLKELAAAVKELEWYTGGGGYRLTGVAVEGEKAVWSLEVQPAPGEGGGAPAKPGAGRTGAAAAPPERRRTVEAGDTVLVETKGQQMSRRFGGAEAGGVEGVVFRVLTRGPHPHGMKVELRDRTVGRVKQNLTVPGAGEPTGGR